MIKRIKDYSIKLLLGKQSVPSGLLELNQYFRHYGPIQFRLEKTEDGKWLARSVNFQYGAIITTVSSEKELEDAIRDAILTSFEIPSSYAQEAQIQKVGGKKDQKYALA